LHNPCSSEPDSEGEEEQQENTIRSLKRKAQEADNRHSRTCQTLKARTAEFESQTKEIREGRDRALRDEDSARRELNTVKEANEELRRDLDKVRDQRAPQRIDAGEDLADGERISREIETQVEERWREKSGQLLQAVDEKIEELDIHSLREEMVDWYSFGEEQTKAIDEIHRMNRNMDSLWERVEMLESREQARQGAERLQAEQEAERKAGQDAVFGKSDDSDSTDEEEEGGHIAEEMGVRNPTPPADTKEEERGEENQGGGNNPAGTDGGQANPPSSSSDVPRPEPGVTSSGDQREAPIQTPHQSQDQDGKEGDQGGTAQPAGEDNPMALGPDGDPELDWDYDNEEEGEQDKEGEAEEEKAEVTTIPTDPPGQADPAAQAKHKTAPVKNRRPPRTGKGKQGGKNKKTNKKSVGGDRPGTRTGAKT
jgi:hypothetical protein